MTSQCAIQSFDLPTDLNPTCLIDQMPKVQEMEIMGTAPHLSANFVRKERQLSCLTPDYLSTSPYLTAVPQKDLAQRTNGCQTKKAFITESSCEANCAYSSTVVGSHVKAGPTRCHENMLSSLILHLDANYCRP